MRFPRRRRQGAAAIELTPLIDVVFLLLIFFMTSTVFVRQSRMEIDLPPALGAATPDAAAPRLTIDAGGDYALNDEPLADGAPETLVAALRATVGEPRRLVIAADAEAAHRTVVAALEAAARAGIQRVGVATAPPP